MQVTWRLDGEGRIPRAKWALAAKSDSATVVERTVASLISSAVDVTENEAIVKRALAAVKGKHALRVKAEAGGIVVSPGASISSASASSSSAADGDDDIDIADYAAEAGLSLPSTASSSFVSIRFGTSTSARASAAAAAAAASSSSSSSSSSSASVGAREHLVRWESPLVAAQRAEGFVVAYGAGPSASPLRIWRLSPIDVQAAITAILADAIGAVPAPTIAIADAGAETDSSPVVTSSAVTRVPLGGLSAAVVDAVYESAARDARAFAGATRSLEAQRTRIRTETAKHNGDGGAAVEEWTRKEKLEKLSKLQMMVMAVYARAEVEPAAACDHGQGEGGHNHSHSHSHSHGHSHGAVAYEMEGLSELDKSILQAYKDGLADIGYS